MSTNTLLALLQAVVCIAASVGAIIGIVSVGEVAIISCITAATSVIVSTLNEIEINNIQTKRSIIEILLNILSRLEEQ